MPIPLVEELCWQAVLDRDSAYDGEFVYAVRSTGVFCRPTCTSRKPNRENVAFFALPEAAAQAGFRPCKRCQPETAEYSDLRAVLVRRICALIDQNDGAALTLDELGAAVNVSPYHLQRTFKALMGITPRQYAETRRVQQLKARLRSGAAVTHALYDAGYGSSSRLYEQAPQTLGMTPSAYRAGAAGLVVVYALADSPLQRLLVAQTERGICAVSLGDDDAALVDALRAEFPHAEIVRDDEGLSAQVQALLAHLNGWQPHLDLPLDLRATAFQTRVWAALRAIPYGETRTYQQIAAEIGQPSAVRAVASACAHNRLALLIPCHRVVRADGSASGYRWGAARKAALLEREHRQSTRTTGA